MPRLALPGWLLLVAALLAAAPVRAQGGPGAPPLLRLEARDTPLAEVLRDLGRQAGVDIVFAERAVAGRAVTGRYVGDDVEAALRVVLRDSGLRAERVRPRQYVVVPALPAPLERWVPPVRGTLSGTVVDTETGESLPGAHVVLAGLGLGAVTNAAGYFALPDLPAGTYRVRVSHVGYRTVEAEIPVYPEAKLERPVIRLEPQPLVVGDVVVEGSDADRRDLEPVPGTTTVGLRVAETLPALLGEGDLFAAMEWLPGVARAAEAGGELIVRGAEAQYNRYFLDGAPVIHPWHAFGLFSVFQPEALRAVRLHRGSLPAEYGGGLSAVVDVELRDGERGAFRGTAALSPVAARTVVEAPLGSRASVMVSARRTWLDLLLRPRFRFAPESGLPALTFGLDEPGDTGDTSFGFHDLGAKTTLRLADGHRLSLSGYAGADRLRSRTPVAGAGVPPGARTMPGGGAADGPLRRDVAFDWGNRIASARYRGLLRDDLFLTATLYHSRYFADETSFLRTTAASALAAAYRVRHAESGLRLDVDYYRSLAHQIRAGLLVTGRDFAGALAEERRRSVSLVETRTEEERVRALEVAAYVQDTWQPAPGWLLQPGLRAEVFGLGPHVALSPRLHLRRELLGETLVLRAGLSRQTQPLHRLRDRYADAYDLASDRWVPASDRVRPASAWQASAELTWRPRSDLAVSAELYGRRLYDVLLPRDPLQRTNGVDGPDVSTGALLDQYVPGLGRAMGLELAATFERGRWRSGLAYALSRVEERTPEEPFRPARYDAPHQLEAFVVAAGRRWVVSLAATARSGYPYTAPTARYALGDPLDPERSLYAYRPELHNARLPVYARVDLGVAYGFRALGLDWEAQGQAYNLLNRRNTVGLRIVDDTAPSADARVAGFPLLPMVSLRARW